jgi:pimeloyl-ACP methyl ester carboxylesterase
MNQHPPGFLATDHTFTVPLDHAQPHGPTIQVYGREVRRRGGADRPWLVFLQGGPGSESPRPTDLSGWWGAAMERFTVLLLDQRGTGRSTPANRQTLRGLTGTEQADYLAHFRADAIVADCELIRRQLLGPSGTWSVLGQSFGGFCATTYLSQYPEFLDRVLITGGLPPLDTDAEGVYRHTYPKVVRRNDVFHQRYPGDAAVLDAIRDRLASGDVVLPGGDVLSPQRLQFLGQRFGMTGGYEEVHYLLEEAFAGPGELSDRFLAGVEEGTSLTVNPLYAVLHEAAYSHGPATRWAADRVLAEYPALRADHSRFNFTGEMIYPWMFDEYAALCPLREAAHRLAERTGWPPLYDLDRLAGNEVPLAATVYYDDLYVARELSMECAERIRGARVWVTNEYEHDGLRRDGGAILDRLLSLADGG